MKLKYQLSLLAIEDLDSIWLYTRQTWSSKQANKYYNEIIESIEIICSNPQIGKPLSEVKEHHRTMPVNSHMIIYKIEEEQIWIDRILHQRMDIDSIYE